ncbi:MAG: hypothetical protein IT453_12405, partial [Planctomycetes bacterium]|nr:hypothetical protein [Planctomycetota bacterium]
MKLFRWSVAALAVRLALAFGLLLACRAASHEPVPTAVAETSGSDSSFVEPALPELPPVTRETPAPPRDGPLARNGAVVGAFGAQGERVRYSFDARAGETCSLDLACYGNARGWRST